jgi:hypothetical protein
MFRTTFNDDILVSTAASKQLKMFDQSIGLRISLQRLNDAANQLPVDDNLLFDENVEIRNISEILTDLKYLLKIQMKGSENSSNHNFGSSNIETEWNDIIELQNKLTESWEPIVNKWHARVNFGSEKVKSSMKIFNRTIWQQVY